MRKARQMTAQLVNIEAISTALSFNGDPKTVLIKVAINDARAGADLLLDLKAKYYSAACLCGSITE